MEHFIQLSNFAKITPYAQLFKQGLLVTVLLSLFTTTIYLWLISLTASKELSILLLKLLECR